MFEKFSGDNDENDEQTNTSDVAAVPEDVEDATIYNTDSKDLLNDTVDSVGSVRLADGVVDGFETEVTLSGHNSTDRSGWKVKVEAYPTDAVPSTSNRVTGMRETNTYDTHFTAAAVFEKLVERYDLTEHEFGLGLGDATDE